jgi:hypothetical protein
MTQDELLDLPGVKDRYETARAMNPDKRLRLVETAGGVIILRQPTVPEFRMWEEALYGDDAKQQASASRLLLQSICVDLDAAGFAQLLTDYPGITMDRGVLLEMRKVAGAAKESDLK